MHDPFFQEQAPTPAHGWAFSTSRRPSDPVQEYRALARELQDAAVEMSASQLDKQIAWIMAHYDGYSSGAITQAMREASVHLARHGGDVQAYVARSMDEAMQEDPFGDTVLGWGG